MSFDRISTDAGNRIRRAVRVVETQLPAGGAQTRKQRMVDVGGEKLKLFIGKATTTIAAGEKGNVQIWQRNQDDTDDEASTDPPVECLFSWITDDVPIDAGAEVMFAEFADGSRRIFAAECPEQALIPEPPANTEIP